MLVFFAQVRAVLRYVDVHYALRVGVTGTVIVKITVRVTVRVAVCVPLGLPLGLLLVPAFVLLALGHHEA